MGEDQGGWCRGSSIGRKPTAKRQRERERETQEEGYQRIKNWKVWYNLFRVLWDGRKKCRINMDKKDRHDRHWAAFNGEGWGSLGLTGKVEFYGYSWG